MSTNRSKRFSIAKKFDAMRADYDMSQASRFVQHRRGVAPLGSSPDYHYRSETKYYSDIEQCRAMDRNDGLVGINADRRVDNIVQGGFTLDPKTGDKGLDLELFNRWKEFSEDADQCDVAGENVWKEMERICCRAESIDGDIVVVGTDEGSFQILEAHTIQTKTKIADTFCGVTTNSFGKRITYHVLEDEDSFGRKSEPREIAVRDETGVRQVFHVYNPKRVLQTRGVTQLAPVFALSGMLDTINFSKLVQQQMASMWAIIHEFDTNPGDSMPSVVGYGNSTTEIGPTGANREIEGVSPGMDYWGVPGEKLSGFSPNIPNSEYFQQVRLIMQIIGLNFGLPYCLLMMDGSETNFSGWRGAVDEARKGFVADQMNLVRRLNTPAYVWKVSKWIDSDRSLSNMQTKFDLFAHNWNLPTWSYIEPVADAEGDIKQLSGALTSPRRLHASRGKDWEEVSEEIIEDNSYAIERAIATAAKINAANPQGPAITWRDLIPLPMPTGTTMAMQDPAAIKVQAQAAEAVPVDGSEPVDDGEKSLTGLNGAQVSSLAAIIEQVTKGAMPKETAKALIASAFPDFGDARIASMINPIKEGEAVGEAIDKKEEQASEQVPGADVELVDKPPEQAKAKRVRKPRAKKNPVSVTINMPENKTPEINVNPQAAQITPVINVHVPEQTSTINVAAPIVTIEQPKAVATKTTVVRDERGEIDHTITEPISGDSE